MWKFTCVLLIVLLVAVAVQGDSTRKVQVPKNENASDDENYKALEILHAELDDDHDGQVNRNESNDYMMELKVVESKKEQKQKNMFREDQDEKISLNELWKRWKNSEVYKWSTEEVIHWLKYYVLLPEYASILRKKHVSGKTIPRLATPQGAYVQKELRITNSQHRRAIYLSASDLLLFGIPDDFKPLQKDKSFQAIKAVHTHLDDDSDGKIDADESQEYMDEELGVSSSKRRHLMLHNNDNHISVDELWESWQESVVHDWSTDQVVDWLKNVVGLPQYEKVFREKNINGKCIPRIATDKSAFLQSELKIKNPKHRRKIYLKASDIILFGVPEVHRSYFNDTIVAIIVVIATLVCVYAFHEKNRQRKQIEDMTKDLVSLQQAEDALQVMQESLAIAEKRHQSSEGDSEREKILLHEIEAAKKEAERLHQERDKGKEGKIKLALVEQELSEVRLALAKAEFEMKSSGRMQVPKALQQWLQKTYQLEAQTFQLQKNIAMVQMSEAKEACEKVSKARRSMLGSLRLAHGQTIEIVDQKIINARGALAEVTNHLQERQHRWYEIEELCGFSIVTDGLFTNFQRIARKSSLVQALQDISTLPLSPVEMIDEETEGNQSQNNIHCVGTRRSNFRNIREDSFESSNSSGSKSGGSGRQSRNGSMVSQQTCAQPDHIPIENTELKTYHGNPEETTAAHNEPEQTSAVQRSISEKTFTMRAHERPILRVHTDPIDLSKRARENVLNGKTKRNSVEINGDTKSLKSHTSRNSNYIGNEDSQFSLNYYSDEEDGSENGGTYSDESSLSSMSTATAVVGKKKKRKAASFRRLFHRKNKADS